MRKDCWRSVVRRFGVQSATIIGTVQLILLWLADNLDSWDPVIACCPLCALHGKTCIYSFSTVPLLYRVGEGKGPIHFTNFECNGTEDSLLECSYEVVETYSNDLCVHTRDVHVACRGKAPVLCLHETEAGSGSFFLSFFLLLYRPNPSCGDQ